MNLYEKIVEVMRDIAYLQKDDKVGDGSNSYKAISIEKVTTTTRESLIKNKLVIVPIKQERKESFMEYEKENSYKGTVEKKQRLMSEVDVTYRIINAEKPDEYIDVVSAGCGVDTQDKGIGKAMTYAYKNRLLRSFAIPTGDDPDVIHNDKLEQETTVTKPKQQSKVEPKPLMIQLNEKLKLAKWNSPKALSGIKEKYKVSNLQDMTDEQLQELIKLCEEHIKTKGE